MNKNIVLCFDGSGNEIEQNASNVLKLFYYLDKKAQLAFYDPGVATISSIKSKYLACIPELIQMNSGYGLQENLMQGYRLLMEHYQHGDKVYLFGFSRGAYTARALAGFIYRVGLLHIQHSNSSHCFNNRYGSW